MITDPPFPNTHTPQHRGPGASPLQEGVRSVTPPTPSPNHPPPQHRGLELLLLRTECTFTDVCVYRSWPQPPPDQESRRAELPPLSLMSFQLPKQRLACWGH